MLWTGRSFSEELLDVDVGDLSTRLWIWLMLYSLSPRHWVSGQCPYVAVATFVEGRQFPGNVIISCSQLFEHFIKQFSCLDNWRFINRIPDDQSCSQVGRYEPGFRIIFHRTPTVAAPVTLSQVYAALARDARLVPYAGMRMRR